MLSGVAYFAGLLVFFRLPSGLLSLSSSFGFLYGLLPGLLGLQPHQASYDNRNKIDYRSAH
jgi:hypothetical protein